MFGCMWSSDTSDSWPYNIATNFKQELVMSSGGVADHIEANE